jgi:hypothetical protein
MAFSENIIYLLILVGAAPSAELEAFQNSLYKEWYSFICKGLSDDFINTAYSGTSCLLFPSL